MKKYTAIDLFCGAGGLSYGFERAGFDIIAGIDNNKDALKTFAYNHASSQAIYQDLSVPIDNLQNYKGVDVVIGGPPCQGFSIAGKRDVKDIRNKLYKVYLKTLFTIKPKIFIMENVPNLISMDNGKIKDAIIQELGELGYHVTYKILNASYFGVPQNRKRVFIIGYYDKPLYLLNGTDLQRVTCKEAISDLPENSLYDGSPYSIDVASQYQKNIRESSLGIWNHQITNHNERTIEIISHVPDGGNYKNLPDKFKDTRKVNIAWTRYDGNKPSCTIDTGHRHHFHYQYNRVPTVRESARLQSFPDKFIFLGSKTSQYRQVGNAVPPLMAEKIAQFIIGV